MELGVQSTPDGVRSSELHLPIDQRVNLRAAISEDVLHSFYVPAFRLKQDIIPGSIISYSLTPTKRGHGSGCGTPCSAALTSPRTRPNVIVESEQTYDGWLKAFGQTSPCGPASIQDGTLYDRRLSPGRQGLGHGAASSCPDGERPRRSLPPPRRLRRAMTSTNYDPRILKAPHPVPGAPDNWKRFFSFNTDAKVIGIQYIATSLFFLLVGGLLAMIVRGELITPPADLVDPSVYNGLYTMHGTVMLFLFLFPILNGFNNLLIPTMIGAPDMAFPKLNAAAFWLVPVFAVVLMGSFFAPGGPASSGWWSYPPMSLQNPLGPLHQRSVALDVWRWLLSGISSIMGAVNFVTTIIRMRAPGMGFFKMPVFVWTAWAAQTIQLVGLPALTGGAVMLLFDLSFGTSFFRPEGRW